MIDHTYGVCLDTLKESNLEKYRTWRNDVRIRSWCRQTGLISQDDQKRWFDRVRNDPTIRMFEVVVDAGDCTGYLNLVGVCGLTSIDRQNNNAEFSLYIGPEYQGQGFGEKALKTLFHYGFSDMGLHRIWGETFSSNPAMALFLRIGMKEEGILRHSYWKAGRWIDSHILSMLSTEFESLGGKHEYK